MLDFLFKYWMVILIGIGFTGYIVFLIIKRRWDKLQELAYKMIRQAESAIVGNKKGQD